jgi:hypothetical protein
MTNASLFRTSLVLAASLTFAGCELIGDIFQAGFFVGIIIVVLILAIVVWLFRKMGGRRTP